VGRQAGEDGRAPAASSRVSGGSDQRSRIEAFLRTGPALPRPSGVRLLVAGSKSASFPSSHAWNSFTAATIVSHFYSRPVGVFFLALAALVAFSRIYVGLHYPIDVLAGALLGLLSGTLFVRGWRRVEAWRAARAEADPA
jgi:membrane-associated phospholipid phosphatase